MPHVVIKLFKGRTEEEKQRLAERVALAVMNAIGASDESISVAVQDVDPEEWTEKVFDPDIAGNSAVLYKRPGYDRF